MQRSAVDPQEDGRLEPFNTNPLDFGRLERNLRAALHESSSAAATAIPRVGPRILRAAACQRQSVPMGANLPPPCAAVVFQASTTHRPWRVHEVSFE